MWPRDSEALGALGALCGQCGRPATIVLVTVNGWMLDCCASCAVMLVDPAGQAEED